MLDAIKVVALCAIVAASCVASFYIQRHLIGCNGQCCKCGRVDRVCAACCEPSRN